MRITQKDLEAKVARLNRIAGIDNPGYDVKGCYVLYCAYGGVDLHRYVGKHGGISSVFSLGCMSKRELYQLISAYENGLMDR